MHMSVHTETHRWREHRRVNATPLRRLRAPISEKRNSDEVPD